MRPTTLRLDESTLDALDSEYGEYGYTDRSEYIRAIIRNRDPPYANTENTERLRPPTTGDYERLRGRVDDLEDRVDELAADDVGSKSINQQPGGDDAPVLVNDESGGQTDLPGAVDVGDNPHSQTVERAVQWAIEHEPVQRAEVITAFEDEVDINGDSLWKRHIRDALKEAGFEHDRDGGVATWQR